MLFKDRLLGLRRMAVLLHKVAAGKATVDRGFLHHFCIISCVKPHYFRSAFRFAFLRSGFHSCPVLHEHCMSNTYILPVLIEAM